MRRLPTLVAIGLWADTLPTTVEGSKQTSLTVDCVRSDDLLTRVSSDEMLGWLGHYTARWDTASSFTIGAVGAQGRLFDPKGRLLHPAELAAIISAAPSFTGEKRKEVWLGVSDSTSGGENSYAKRLGRLLGTKVIGCEADAYFMANGAMLCGSKPIFANLDVEDRGRSMPLGFALGDSALVMLFCAREGASISPQSMLTSSVAFGLRPDERVGLEADAATQPDAAFRLYQYHWIARRDPIKALAWLEKAAALGSGKAKFNLAYELLERGTTEDRNRARGLLDDLAASGAAYPDLRKFYSAE